MSVTVVLIEDHAALRQGLELLLPQEGIEVEGAAAGPEEGLVLVREWEPDVAVIDVGLGETSGIDLARKILSVRPEQRIVLYTGRCEEQVLFEGLDSGAAGFALKEGTIGELVEAIRCVADGGTYVDPRLRGALLSRESTARLPTLSPREREVVDLLAQGLNGEEIADRLVLSAETVKTHVRNAMTKLEARSRTHAVAIALREGLISMRSASIA